MRDLHDTLTRGGFRDDTHRAAVEAAAVDLAPGHLREPQAAISGGPATSVWSGGRNGSGDLPTKLTQVEANPLYLTLQSACQQVNEAERELRKFGYRNRKQAPGMRPPKATVMLVAPDALDAHVTILQDAFAAIYDAATRALASAGPLPLASTEPWAETDQAYRARLSDYLGYNVTYSGSMLDDYGVEAAELPRLRLVPATTKEGM